MGIGSGLMIKNPLFFFTAKNNSQTTLTIVIGSVKCAPTLPIIPSSCLESCGVCDGETVCIVSEFKPTDTTTDGSDPSGPGGGPEASQNRFADSVWPSSEQCRCFSDPQQYTQQITRTYRRGATN